MVNLDSSIRSISTYSDDRKSGGSSRKTEHSSSGDGMHLDVPNRSNAASTTASSSTICSVEEALSRTDEAAGVSVGYPRSIEDAQSDLLGPNSRTNSSLSSLIPPNPRCYIPRRHIVTFLSFLAFAVIYAVRSNLSIAIIQMTSNTTLHKEGNGTVVEPLFNWNSVEQGEILGAFFWGYIITQIPGGWLAARLGGKFVLLVGVLGTSVFTLVVPPAAKFGKPGLMVARALQGFFQGVAYPAMHAILGNWAPTMEKTLMSGIVYAGSYFGTVIAMPLSAYLDNLGWAAIFYFFGAIGVLWCFLWLRFFTDKPEKARGISKQELILLKHKENERGEQLNVPWLYIFRSKEVWCVVVCHFCQNCGFYVMLTQIPTIQEKLLHYSHHATGVLAALPYLAMGLVLSFGGPFVDYLRTHYKWWTTVRTRKIFCFCGFVGSGLSLLIVAINTYSWIRFLGLIISLGFGGFSFLSFSANILDIAPQYAGYVMGLSNTFATVPGFLEPLFVGAVVTDQQPWQWRIVFYVTAGIYVFGGFLFVILAKGEVLPWARKQ